MQALLPIAEKIAARLDRAPRDHRRYRILDRRADRRGFAECSRRVGLFSRRRGGLHASTARAALLGIGDADMAGLRPSTEAYSLLIARRVRERHGATWGLGETGATGPTGNRYGDAAGHTCIAVAGPVERAITLETGSADRRANMEAFAKRALELLYEAISAKT